MEGDINVKLGDIFKVPLTTEDEITPKGGW